MTKRCILCYIVKAGSAFYPGRNRCKECKKKKYGMRQKLYARKFYRLHHDDVKPYVKAYAQRIKNDPERYARLLMRSALASARYRARKQMREVDVPRLVMAAANQFRCSADERDELLSVGWIGAAHAYKRFDPRKKVPFGAYAMLRIRGEMLDELDRIAPRRERERQFDERVGFPLVTF